MTARGADYLNANHIRLTRYGRNHFGEPGHILTRRACAFLGVQHRQVARLLVAARRTTFPAPVIALGPAPDSRDFLHEQGELFLKFPDALTVAFDFLEQGREFRPVT